MADAELFGRYRDALDTNAGLARSEVQRVLDAVAGMGPDDAYEYVRRNYPKLMRAYGSVAAEVARLYYQGQRDEYDLDDEYTATSYGAGEAAWYEQDVDSAYGRSDDGEGHRLVTPEDLLGRAVQRTMERADHTLDQNMWDDPVRVGWAIVPHPGACGFCVMVGANGFTYHSRESALSQRHPGCKCAVCVDWADDPRLDGYDPTGLYAIYDQAARVARPEADELWSQMSTTERAKYSRKGRSAKDVFRTKVITRHIDQLTGHAHGD